MITIEGIFSTGVPILIFILILGIVVFVHEFGHFIMARRAGIFVEEFAMGMGPKLLAFRGKKKAKNALEGEEDVTLYTLRLLPVGGFCKMRGMEENIPNDPESMGNKSVFDRILVIAGGSAMNFILAFIIFTVLAFLGGFLTPTVIGIAEDSPAQAAGLQIGDRVTHINNTRVTLWENLRFTLDMNGGQEMNVRIRRNSQRMTLTMTPQQGSDGVYRIGFSPDVLVGFLDRNELVSNEEIEFRRAGIGASVGNAVEMIGFNIRLPFRLLARLITRQPMPAGAGVQSVIGIAGEVTEIYQITIQHGIMPTVLTMLSIAGLISVALGTMNLLPIPALDGARLIFLIIEGIRRKPVSQEREGMVHFAGFVLLMVLLVVVAGRDIVNLIQR